MHFDIVMPKLGESVTEGTVARWLKEVGDPIARDESVLEITTDKIDTDVPAIEGGILSEILVAEGTTVDVGERLGIITKEGEEVIVATGETDGWMTDEAGPPEKDTTPAQVPMHIERSSNYRSSQGRFYSPLVRRIAREEHIDLLELDTIHGSGRNGRLTKKDLLAHLKQRTGTA
ncbi:MAG: biotin/lipoyl-containing protein, partial [Candidatus Latescibacteria bacterium]|nr:biotin/lipoyl-containing protein [Candidatus Latescibacterota bacterium]